MAEDPSTGEGEQDRHDVRERIVAPSDADGAKHGVGETDRHDGEPEQRTVPRAEVHGALYPAMRRILMDRREGLATRCAGNGGQRHAPGDAIPDGHDDQGVRDGEHQCRRAAGEAGERGSEGWRRMRARDECHRYEDAVRWASVNAAEHRTTFPALDSMAPFGGG